MRRLSSAVTLLDGRRTGSGARKLSIPPSGHSPCRGNRACACMSRRIQPIHLDILGDGTRILNPSCWRVSPRWHRRQRIVIDLR